MIPAATDYTDPALGTAREDSNAIDTPTVGSDPSRTVNLLRIDPRRDEIAADQKRHVEHPELVIIPVEIVRCTVLLYPKRNNRAVFKCCLRLYRITYSLEVSERPGDPDHWLLQEGRQNLAADCRQQVCLQG